MVGYNQWGRHPTRERGTIMYLVKDTRRTPGYWGCWSVVDPFGGRLFLATSRELARICARNLNEKRAAAEGGN